MKKQSDEDELLKEPEIDLFEQMAAICMPNVINNHIIRKELEREIFWNEQSNQEPIGK